MSYQFWGMAVKADPGAVREALLHWPSEGEARFEECPGDPEYEEGWVAFTIAPHGPWTVFCSRFRQRVIPTLALHLSRALSTRVISVDQDGTTGYEHFSVLDAGSVSQVFTTDDNGDPEEIIGIDFTAFYERAKQSGKMRLRPRALDEDEELYLRGQALRIFNVVVSDINVEDLAAELEDDDVRIWAGAHEDGASAKLARAGHGAPRPRWRDLV